MDEDMNDRELLNALQRLYLEHERRLKDGFDRSIPFADAILDNRWSRAERLGFGQGTSIYDSALVLGNVKVGCNTWIGPFTLLDGSGDLEIGHYCSISAGVQIYTHDTVAWATSGGNQAAETARVTVGSRCYIGPNTVISKGVAIGDGCVIGANSFVNRDIPDGMKAWGSPARVIGATAIDLHRSSR